MGLALVLALVAASGAVASARSSRASETPVRGGDLVVGVYQEPGDINPLTSQDNESVAIWSTWWEYLVRPNADASAFMPSLATRWTISPDKRQYVFKLRSGVTFQDGQPLTSADVVGSLHRAFSTATSQLSYLNAKLASMTAPDPLTVKIVFKKPWPYLVGDLSGYVAAIMPQKLIKSEGYAKFLQHPVGTGPFMFDHWAHGNELVVKRNPKYWLPKLPYLDSVTFRVMPSDPARVTAVEGKQADVAEAPPRNQLSGLKTRSGLKILTFPASRSDAIIVNVTQGPLKDPRVRQALSLAIDRKSVLQAAVFGYGAVSKSFIVPPPAVTFQNPALNLYPYNPDKAKALLAAAGVKDLKLNLEVTTGVDQSGIAQVVKSDLGKVGVSVSIVTKDPTSWFNDLVKQKFQLITSYWSSLVPDPTAQVLYTMDPAFCCKSFNSGWKDPAAIAAAQAATSASGSRARVQKLYDTAQRLEAQGMNTIPLYESTVNFLTSDNVHGFVSSLYGAYYLEKTWKS